MKRILIGEDEETIRSLYKIELESEGFEVDVAENGNKVLEKIEENQYDLILLDIMMPGLSGMEVLNQIKEKQPNMKVVLNTAYSDFKSDFSAWAADLFLVKSSDIDEFKSKIKALLEK